MASIHAIAVTANAVRGLLANACPRSVFPGADFKLYQANNFQAQPLLDFGVTVYLHRVAFNTTRRSLPPRQTLDGRRFRGPTPLDLYFLVTAWAKTADAQLELLGWTIRTLQNTLVLPAGLLNRFAGERGQVFRDNETVELVGEVLSAQDLMNIWEIAKANQQPSVAYVARMVLLDSDEPLTESELVQTRGFDMAVMKDDQPITTTS